MRNGEDKSSLPGRRARPVPGGYAVDDVTAAIGRLAAYENLHEGLLAENERLSDELAQLRAAGMDRTAHLRDLLERKLQIVYALSLFSARSL